MLERDINIAQWIDSKFMPGKLYQEVWDPEGILSTFPSIVTGITGMLAGTLLLKMKSQEYKVIWLFLARIHFDNCRSCLELDLPFE